MLQILRSLWIPAFLIGLGILIASCGTTSTDPPPPPSLNPTLSLEEIQTFVASTMAAEAAASAPAPTATEPPPATDTPLPTPINTSTLTITPTITLPPASGADCIPKGTLRHTARVISVTDGDTIRVEIDGQSVPVRYIGIDTPEVGQPFYNEATNHNSSLVIGQTVTLVKDVSETDQFNRILRYVLVGNDFVNYRLVRDGYAFGSTYAPDVACASAFADAQSLARSDGRGSWVATPTPGCDPSYPDFCIPSPPPDLDCVDIGRDNFTVRQPDPHRFDGDRDGVGCEVSASPPPAATSPPPSGNCHPSYPTVCIPPPPPDLDCGEISFRRFTVIGSDPHGFDGDNDGIGCESG